MSINYQNTPIYTVSQVARIVCIPPSTMAAWTERKNGLVTRDVKAAIGTPSIPFVGLTEAYVLAALRRQANLSMQAIKKAVKKLKLEYGVDHPLASQKFRTDGADFFYELAEELPASGSDAQEIKKLIRIKTGQIAFSDIVSMFLKRIEYSKSGIAEVIQLQGYTFKAVVDPRRSYGMPIIDRVGVRISDVVGQLKAGEDWQNIMEGYGVKADELEEIALANLRAA